MANGNSYDIRKSRFMIKCKEKLYFKEREMIQMTPLKSTPSIGVDLARIHIRKELERDDQIHMKKRQKREIG